MVREFEYFGKDWPAHYARSEAAHNAAVFGRVAIDESRRDPASADSVQELVSIVDSLMTDERLLVPVASYRGGQQFSVYRDGALPVVLTANYKSEPHERSLLGPTIRARIGETAMSHRWTLPGSYKLGRYSLHDDLVVLDDTPQIAVVHREVRHGIGAHKLATVAVKRATADEVEAALTMLLAAVVDNDQLVANRERVAGETYSQLHLDD